jgi:hypothetical protein
MLLWSILCIVFPALSLEGFYTVFEANATMTYFLNFFQVLSFVIILCIAKHTSWSNSLGANDPMFAPKNFGQNVQQQQLYAYAPSPNSQVYYGQQAPVYNDTPEFAAR